MYEMSTENCDWKVFTSYIAVWLRSWPLDANELIISVGKTRLVKKKILLY